MITYSSTQPLCLCLSVSAYLLDNVIYSPPQPPACCRSLCVSSSIITTNTHTLIRCTFIHSWVYLHHILRWCQQNCHYIYTYIHTYIHTYVLHLIHSSYSHPTCSTTGSYFHLCIYLCNIIWYYALYVLLFFTRLVFLETVS